MRLTEAMKMNLERQRFGKLVVIKKGETRVTYISNISTKGESLIPCFESQNVEHELETTFTF